MIINNISKFILDTHYENLTKESVDKVKLCFLDYLAVTNKGINQKPTQKAIKTLKQLNQITQNNTNLKKSKCTIIGSNETNYFNEIDTAFINGISAHVLDLDDGHRLAQLHPGAIVFSTALSVSQSNNSSIKEFIESVIVGYQIAIVLGQLCNPNHRQQGFHSTGTIGTFAAGATASKLLKLNQNQINSTLGLSGTQAAGLLESDHSGSMGKVLHVGKAIYNGILSAYLSKNGFTGPNSIIEGKQGFLSSMAISTQNDIKYLDKFLIKNLNTIRINEIYHKKYPFCRHIHSSIDSTLKLKQQLNQNHININQIKKVKIETYKIAAEHNNFEPHNIEELKQSLPLAIALTLTCENLSLNSIDNLINNGLFNYSKNKNNENIKQITQITKILEKITIKEEEKLNAMFPEKRPANVKIILKNEKHNKIFENITYLPLGEKENPLTKEDILNKFSILNPNYDTKKLEIINNMENYTINEIINKINKR